MTAIILIVVWILCFAWFFTQMRRISIIHAKTSKALIKIRDLCTNDIKNGKEWEWRYDALDKEMNEAYHRTLFMFWKSLSHLYENNPALKIGAWWGELDSWRLTHER
jgi:hypothetical protein